MVANYKRKTTQGSWTEESMRLAMIEARRSTISAASKMYGIPIGTLHRHLAKDSCKKKLGHYRPVFTENEERQLSNLALDLDRRLDGLTQEGMRELAYEFAKRSNIPHPFKDDMAGHAWISGFMNRHKELRLRTPEPATITSASVFNRLQVSRFYDNLWEVLTENDLLARPFDVYNVDETGVETSSEKSPKVATATHEADAEITTEQHLFYAAVKTEPSCGPSSPPPFASVRIKEEPGDYDGVSAGDALHSVPPVEMVDVDSVAVTTEYDDEDMVQWRDSNPDVDPLRPADVKEELKEETNDDAVYCHKEATEAFSWPLLDDTQDPEHHPETSPSRPASPPGRVCPTTKIVDPTTKGVDLTTKMASPSPVCPVCSKTFKHRCLLRKHLAVHSELRPFTCTQCDKTFKCKSSLLYHARRHSGDMPFPCTKCEMRFYFKTNLSTHLLSHSDATELSCSLCGKGFKCRSYLNRHMRGHAENAPFACDRCALTFKFQRNLEYHQLEHTNVRAFACDRCPKTFKRRAHLASHVAAIHADGETFACDRCPSRYKTRRHFLQHVASHAARRFECDECAATFGCERELSRHAVSHSTGVPFSCGDCAKGFTTKPQLVRHLVVHATEKPFECDTCLVKCKTKGVLVRHLKCHSDERPWACGQCDARFKRKYQLSHHSIKHGAKIKTEQDVSNVVAPKYYI